ncbi:hypothetical protein HYX01_02715 [Candidatus Woesearchaeota archaeon]|nr:hypothetical protein [Candidatus Woesearchaeota archaeon]
MEIKQTNGFSGLVSKVRGLFNNNNDNNSDVQNNKENVLSNNGSVEQPILPWDVRYALSQCEGNFGIDELISLQKPEYCGIGTYLALKALDGNPENQQALLTELVNHFHTERTYRGISSIVLPYLDNMPNVNVQGKKVAQISRIGFDFVDKQFQSIARDIYSNERLPLLLAYAALIGLKLFIEEMPDCATFGIINPKQLEGKPADSLGYLVSRSGTYMDVRPLKQPDLTSSCITLVDDTRKTGGTFSITTTFLEGIVPLCNIKEKYVVRLSKQC